MCRQYTTGIVQAIGWRRREGGMPYSVRERTSIAPQRHAPSLPARNIGHAVWLYFHFALGYRDAGELLAERGVIVAYATIRRWCRKFGQTYANALRWRRPRPGDKWHLDKWHLDEVFITINGQAHCRWRAVDREGTVLAIPVQSRCNKATAAKFLRKLLKGLRHVPRVLITDKLASYGAAHRATLRSVEHRRHEG